MIFFWSTLKLGKQFLRKFKNIANVCTFKMATTKGNSLKKSLSKRTRKVPNLKKIDISMF